MKETNRKKETMQETWAMITELGEVVKHQQDEMRRLKLLIINIKAKSV